MKKQTPNGMVSRGRRLAPNIDSPCCAIGHPSWELSEWNNIIKETIVPELLELKLCCIYVQESIVTYCQICHLLLTRLWKNRIKNGKKMQRLGRIDEMNTSGNGQPQECRRGTPTRTWCNAEARERWIAPSGSQIWHCSAAAALREGSTTNPCPAAGAAPPTLGWHNGYTSRCPHWPPLLPSSHPRLFNRSWCLYCVRAQGQEWCASSRGWGMG